MEPTFLGLDEVLEIHRDQIEKHNRARGADVRPNTWTVLLSLVVIGASLTAFGVVCGIWATTRS